MAIPLLEVAPTTQNQRVPGYEVPNEDTPLAYRMNACVSDTDVNDLIWAAYRQIFGEHLILQSNRQIALESQLRNKAISVRQFIRGLGKSDAFRDLVVSTNSNYRLVDLICKRFLGRASYGRDEQIAWSIVIASQGLHAFIDVIVDSEEYATNFGDDIVPYQRRRMEARPFNLANPRYNEYWRGRMLEIEGRSYYRVRTYQAGELDRQVVRSAIPSTFLLMAQSMTTPTIDGQRHVARATSGLVQIPDMSSEATPVSVKPVPAALPYRYIPALAKV